MPTWLVRGIRDGQEEVDGAIQAASEHWRIARMAVVDRNILRIAVFEMLRAKTLVPAIVINEAIEIAKKYSGEEASVFINGILDAVRKRLEAGNSARGRRRGTEKEGTHGRKRRKAGTPGAREGREAKLGDQDLARRDKLRRLAEAGVELFPHKADWTHSVAGIVAEYTMLPKEELEEKKPAVRVPGRIMTVRKMGRATFFHISDGRSRLQVYIREDVAGPEAYEKFALLDIGDVVLVAGTLFKTRTGELTVLCASWTFLAKSLHPLPEKWHGLQDVEIRYRKRYLDLIMNPEVGQVFRLRSALVAQMRRFFDERGYMEVETPMMHVIPGGAIARPFKTFHNALGIDLYLRIAPELYLKRLIVGGFDRVYEINRNFRNEGIDSEHNPEFTMIELYQAYSDYEDMMELTEVLLNHLSLTILGKDELPFGEHLISFKRPWKRLKFKDAAVQLQRPGSLPVRGREGSHRDGDGPGAGQEAGDLRQGPGRHLRQARQAEDRPADLHHQSAEGGLAPGQIGPRTPRTKPRASS